MYECNRISVYIRWFKGEDHTMIIIYYVYTYEADKQQVPTYIFIST